MTMIATVRCKDGYVIACDSLVTEGEHTFRSGPKFKKYNDCILGMAGIVHPWPDELSVSDKDLAEFTEENDHVCIIKVNSTDVPIVYENGRGFQVIDPAYGCGSGGSVAVGALASLGEVAHEYPCEQVAEQVEILLTTACKYATSCEPPIHVACIIQDE